MIYLHVQVLGVMHCLVRYRQQKTCLSFTRFHNEEKVSYSSAVGEKNVIRTNRDIQLIMIDIQINSLGKLFFLDCRHRYIEIYIKVAEL